ncbi:MAG TPA: tail fiber domain-containing protein [Bacteroidota bacterium]|nr:tail fiber domain-containing protein [Bacteroidota bacterium]
MRKTFLLLTMLFAATAYAQDITNTIGANGFFYIKDAVNTFLRLNQTNGHIGIGTNVSATPRAQLEVGGTDGLLVTGTVNSGTVTALGAGVRLHWYPRKGAFRVGMAETTYWDDNGSSVTNMALYSIGMGYQARPTGVASTALGAYNKATADYSLSLGSYSNASGTHAIALGTQVSASGIYSVAVGSGADTNGKDGSMVVGDDTYFQTSYSSADNQLTMRFSGGYRLWSSYPDSTAGVYMRHGQSGWSNYCDRNRKENFREVDGEELLAKLRNIPVTEWNYKKTDPREKYIGPMAQDFYAAFHLGGTDSLGINSISIDGVNMAGIKALEKRTREIQATLRLVQEQNTALAEENRILKKELAGMKDLSDEAAALRSLKAELQEQLKILKTRSPIELSHK